MMSPARFLNSKRYAIESEFSSSMLEMKSGKVYLLALFLYSFVGINLGHAKLMHSFPSTSIHLGEVCTDENIVTFDLASVADPVITVRYANPQFDCTSQEYCVDVEFQSDLANKELFGMNVRMFYDDTKLEFIDFRNYEGGYGPVSPNPAIVTTSTAGIPWFNFAGNADYINGAVQKTNINAPPIYISTSGWTKLYTICFDVDVPLNDDSFCPPLVWDLEANPANGGFPPGSAGVVMTVVNGSGSSPASEQVSQFNWEYIGEGSPPYGQPIEVSCVSINCGTCSLVVDSNADSGPGTLREKIGCAFSGDTITFAANMAGATITISTSRLIINKHLYIRSNLTNRVKVISTISGLFEVAVGKTAEFKDLDITSGTMPSELNEGAAFKNSGNLKFVGVKVFKNVSLPSTKYLVRNYPGSQFNMSGNCFIQLP